ncbi:MAG TPA: metallophosphoesterase [Candidatus Dormibacteraeota bacterium]
MPDLPVLIAGDVHGDLERLFAGLKPYPPDRWRTVFLGDLVDGGAFGVGALRYARDRPNSEVILGNHEVMMLWALRDRARLPYWLGIGGQLHDLQELARDEPLEHWLRHRPALLKLEDGTLVQHADTDHYARLADLDDAHADIVKTVNQEAQRLLNNEREDVLWDVTSPGGVFRAGRSRLDAWLRETSSKRLVHGHVPHNQSKPLVYQEGRALNFDGGLSRFYGSRYRRRAPPSASVGPLPPLVD